MTNKKKGWHCPHCPQICPRHWNLLVHIKRKHPDLSAGSNPQQLDVGPDQAVGAGVVSTPQEEVGKFAYLANASNPDLMRWALMQNRLAQPASIERWINLFESNEDRYMMKPIRVTHHALPPGMPHNHPRAERLIRQYEEDKLEERMMKRKKLEKDGVREAFEDYLRSMTLNQMQNRSKEGNGAADPLVQISNLVAAGTMVPVPTIDGNGNNAIRYELRNIATAPTQPQNGNVPGGLVTADILKIIETAYEKSTEILMKCIESRGGEDQIERFDRPKRLADSINPPQTNSIEGQRMKLDERRLDVDRHASRKGEEEESKYRWEQEMKQREETKGQEQVDKLFVSISDMVTNRLPTSSAMFQGQGGEFQVPGSVQEALGRLIGQGGQPQQTQTQPQRQYDPYQDLTAQQAIANHERMVGDKQYVNEIQRMQEAQIRERQKSNSRRRI